MSLPRDRVEYKACIDSHVKPGIKNVKSLSIHVCGFSQVTFTCSSKASEEEMEKFNERFLPGKYLFSLKERLACIIQGYTYATSEQFKMRTMKYLANISALLMD